MFAEIKLLYNTLSIILVIHGLANGANLNKSQTPRLIKAKITPETLFPPFNLTTPTTTPPPLTTSTTAKTTTKPPDRYCGDWRPFKEENCIKIIEKTKVSNYKDAQAKCKVLNSHLISIHSKDELDNIMSYLNESKVTDNVWIGLKYSSTHKKYEWSDGSNFGYSNWIGGKPKNKIDDCVQLYNEEDFYGNWSETACTKQNMVICQKPQVWNLERVEQVVIKLQQDMKQANVPVGFVYLQLPKERSPQEIWPSTNWKSISSEFAGVFFRVDSGNSSKFETEQDENVPSISEYDSIDENEETIKTAHLTKRINNAILPIGDRKHRVYLGDNTESDYKMGSFVTSNADPKSISIKVWERTA